MLLFSLILSHTKVIPVIGKCVGKKMQVPCGQQEAQCLIVMPHCASKYPEELG